MNTIEVWIDPRTGEPAPMQRLTREAAEQQDLELRTLVFRDDLDNTYNEDDMQELRDELEKTTTEAQSWEERYDELYSHGAEALQSLERVIG